MKKRIWLIALVLVICFVLTGCACKHKETQVINASESNCVTDGYTGDTQCVECGEILAEGLALAAPGHSESDIIGSVEATCTQTGKTGYTQCTVCGEILSESKDTILAEHTPSERILASEPSCDQLGYTGDIFCSVCSVMIESGENIACVPHVPGRTLDVYEPSCTYEGYTGDVVCAVCGNVLTAGEIIPALGHKLGEAVNAQEASCTQEGYTGDKTCSICNLVVYGDVTARLPHDYENNVCSVCDWMVPGIYIEGTMSMTWADLVEVGYISVDGTEAIVNNRGLTGLLVVEEGITAISGKDWSEDILIEGLYLPASYTFLKNNDLINFRELKTFRSFGLIEIDNSTNDVYNSVFPETIQKVVLNEGLEVIGTGAFLDAEVLTEFTMPSTVKSIGAGAFRNCSSLLDITLPDGLLTLGKEAFCGCGVKELVIPASVIKLGSFAENYARKWSIERIDISQVNLEILPYQAFSYCKNLKEIKLPSTLKTIKTEAFSHCDSLEYLDIPEGASFEHVPYGVLPSVKYIVWPFSVTELQYDMPALEKIYYRGSEMQWGFVAGKERYEGVEVVFNYTGE